MTKEEVEEEAKEEAEEEAKEEAEAQRGRAHLSEGDG